MAKVNVRKENRSLKCTLTTDERLVKGTDMAKAEGELRRLEEENSRVASQYANSIKTITAQLHAIAEAVRQGYEFRDVECRVETSVIEGRLRVVREDTGEVVEDREMNKAERGTATEAAQSKLFKSPEAVADADKKAEPEPPEDAPKKPLPDATKPIAFPKGGTRKPRKR